MLFGASLRRNKFDFYPKAGMEKEGKPGFEQCISNKFAKFTQ